MSNEVKEIESTRIGSKILRKESVEVILPSYGNIFQNIEVSRSKFSEPIESADNQKYHDNIISILGKRGSGKSSILKTIRMDIKKKINRNEKNSTEECPDYKNDILLPMIMPEIMETNDLIGWIIGYFKSEVDKRVQEFNEFSFEKKQKLTKRLKGDSKDTFDRCCKPSNMQCPIKEFYDKWVEAYIKRRSDYREILKKNYEGEREYQRDFIEYLNSDVNLWNKFNGFISEFTKYIKNESGNTSEPIIFVFFDDLDLIPYNSVKLLESIITYLSRANIMIFIAGDYDNFEERILLNYLRKDKVLEKELYEERLFNKSSNESAVENRRKLAGDFLKKLLTPAYRYYLKEVQRDDRLGFTSGDVRIENEEEREDKETLKDVLVDYSKLISNSKDDNESFHNKFEENLKVFSVLLDDKPRGLINVFSFLKESKALIEKENNKKGKNVEKLVEVLTDSNDIFSSDKSKLRNCFRISSNGGELSLNIKYDEIEELCIMIANDLESNNDSNNVKILRYTKQKILSYYYLAFFVENLFKPDYRIEEILRINQDVYDKFKVWFISYDGNLDNMKTSTLDAKSIFNFEVFTVDENLKIFEKFESNYIADMSRYINVWFEVLKFGVGIRTRKTGKEGKGETSDYISEIFEFMQEKMTIDINWVITRVVELKNALEFDDQKKNNRKEIEKIADSLNIEKKVKDIIVESKNEHNDKKRWRKKILNSLYSEELRNALTELAKKKNVRHDDKDKKIHVLIYNDEEQEFIDFVKAKIAKEENLFESEKLYLNQKNNVSIENSKIKTINEWNSIDKLSEIDKYIQLFKDLFSKYKEGIGKLKDIKEIKVLIEMQKKLKFEFDMDKKIDEYETIRRNYDKLYSEIFSQEETRGIDISDVLKLKKNIENSIEKEQIDIVKDFIDFIINANKIYSDLIDKSNLIKENLIMVNKAFNEFEYINSFILLNQSLEVYIKRFSSNIEMINKNRSTLEEKLKIFKRAFDEYENATLVDKIQEEYEKRDSQAIYWDILGYEVSMLCEKSSEDQQSNNEVGTKSINENKMDFTDTLLNIITLSSDSNIFSNKGIMHSENKQVCFEYVNTLTYAKNLVSNLMKLDEKGHETSSKDELLVENRMNSKENGYFKNAKVLEKLYRTQKIS
jgi:hypothetical protein